MVRTVLADFRTWIVAPRLIAPVPLRQGWRTWAVMVALYLVVLVAIGIVVTVWQRALHLPAPEAFRGYSGRVLAVAVVVAAPIGEEALFRGWLTGRPRALWLLAMAVLGGLFLLAVSVHWHDQVASLGFLVIVVAALVGWLVLRRRAAPPAWFVRGFGVWFYAAVVVFGLAHMANYPRLSLGQIPLMLPMVLPQLWAGLVFGYLRMRHGLLASILAHACGNAAALAVAFSAAH